MFPLIAIPLTASPLVLLGAFFYGCALVELTRDEEPVMEY